MRNLIFGIFVLTSFLSLTSEGYAQCSCLPEFYTAYDEFKGSDAVFVGEVVEIQKGKAIENSKHLEFDVKFKVATAWKTDMPEAITIKNSASDSSEFEVGKIYLVYARLHDNFLRSYIGCCNRTKLLSDAAGDLKMFKRKGEKKKNIVRK
ncbi:MAG TPA: hypothetical protein VK308_04620 [Pyrinomonadaceae bacterium]|nr:hypothetical protein [Pyrinomonadaceae bacterium]